MFERIDKLRPDTFKVSVGAGVRTVEVHAEEFVILVARSVFHIEDTPRPGP